MMRTPRFWQYKNLLSAALLPASALYGIAAARDRRRTPPQHAALPVISVGNVTAGGAGKTPVTLALIPLLQQLGAVPHILSRGYGGQAHAAYRVQATDDWRIVGDEPLLLCAAAPTWVGANRLASADAAQAAGATVLLADDALQHHALYKDLSLLVIDGNYGMGNGRLLPAGPLREPLATALARCDAVVMIGADRHALGAAISLPIFHATLAPTGDSDWLNGAAVLAFAGIARPEKFYATLRACGATIIAMRDFPDHHPYSLQEMESLVAQAAAMQATLVTTAKDAVKIPPHVRSQMRVLEVALQWQDAAALRRWLGEKLTAGQGRADA